MEPKIKHLPIFLAFAALFHLGLGSTEQCLLRPDSGHCEKNDTAVASRFYYSAANLKCSEFPYSGCGGNANNFATEAECVEKCKVKLSQAPAVSKIIAAQKESQCWYRDQTYAAGKQIPATAEDSPCAQGCFCSSYPDGTTPSITCAVVDCEPYPRDKPNCIPIYANGSCCAEFVCPDSGAEAKNTFKCSYEGKDYIEGQRIHDDNYPCISCTCTRNFTGKLTTENGVCKEINCGLTIHNQIHLLADCTPGYYNNSIGKSSCCPIEWDCATKSE